MFILICNDDGIYAPGIKALVDALKDTADLLVVAPLEERSTTGHSLTLNYPLRLVQLKKNHYGCSGFPADCVILAMRHLLAKKAPPDLVISGINRGGNLGQDVYYSGTVAAAREGALNGIPSLAVSLAVDFSAERTKDKRGKEEQIHFETAANFTKKLVEENIHQEIEPMTVLNVNVPNVCEDEITGAGPSILGHRRYANTIVYRKDGRNQPYFWIGGEQEKGIYREGSDCFLVEKNKISLSVLNIFDEKTDKSSRLFRYLKRF